jgi:diguanylate cyclase (GGDEF)-like protein
LIGEFSELTGISKRMLRHYGELGLIEPEYTDPETGYRYFSDGQQSDARNILVLSRLGFSLKEVSEILNGETDAESFMTMLKNREAELRLQIDRESGMLLRIQALIEMSEQPNKDSLLESLQIIDLRQSRSKVMEDAVPYGVGKIKKKLDLKSIELFEEQIERVIEKDEYKEISYVSFDIDKFAWINDNHGYDVGNAVLEMLMQSLMDNCEQASEQSFVSRLGGDEYAVFLVDYGLEEVKTMTQSVLTTFSKSNFSSVGLTKKITASAGIFYAQKVMRLEELRHKSTKALIEAKRARRNCWKLYQE